MRQRTPPVSETENEELALKESIPFPTSEGWSKHMSYLSSSSFPVLAFLCFPKPQPKVENVSGNEKVKKKNVLAQTDSSAHQKETSFSWVKPYSITLEETSII